MQASLVEDDGIIRLLVYRDGEPLLKDIRLGIELEGSHDNQEIVQVSSSEHENSWKPVWGKRNQVQDKFVECRFKTDQYSIVVRIYDDGIAVRYELPADIDGELVKHTILKDLTTFNFATDATCYSYNGENPNIGPEKLSDTGGDRQAPLLAKCADDCYVAIHEAALYDAPWMKLHSETGSNSIRVKTSKYEVKPGFKTPWRVLMVGDTPGDLLDSDLLMNLNPPCQVEDPTWIKPGVCFWDWRAWGHKTKDGFTYGLDLPSWKRFVDFAEETGVPYLLLDANWYGPEFEKESNPTETGKVNDVRELLDYANAHNVGVLLYLNDVAGRKYDLDAVLKNYHEWGAKGIKYGFMSGGGKDKVERTRRIIELCAKNELVVDFHDGPIPPSGDMRTYPNCLTREFCHAQSDSLRAFTPKTFVTACFVNGLAGPLDMANGMFDLENSMAQRPRIFEDVRSTVVGEAARSLIVFTGLNVLPDSPDAYREKAPLFEFIAAQKMPWDESKTLAGEIGQYITTMRRTGDTWLVATATNEEPLETKIEIDFLPPGKYAVVVYRDAPDSHYETNRETYQFSSETWDITGSKTITARLAPGGGHCLKIKRLEEDK
ncbi:MAG: glycoside hydrolase family 97 catalytic domain-containing protein [Lacipirellulaceae bacterium]